MAEREGWRKGDNLGPSQTEMLRPSNLNGKLIRELEQPEE